jgi:RNA polymerase sigma factor (TIGR02999 family)
MRRILIESARRKARAKHGGGRQRYEIDEADVVMEGPSIDLLALDEALNKLAEEDEAKAELVKLRFFAGLTTEEAADILGISRATAERHWAYARAYLHHEVSKGTS